MKILKQHILIQALNLRQLASNRLGSLSMHALWICGLFVCFCVSVVLIPVWVDVLIPVWGRLSVCADPRLCASGCLRPRTSPLSGGSPITLDLWERIHPQGLWNQQGSLQLNYLISLCCSTVSTSYFRLLVAGSWADLQQLCPPCLPACLLVEAKACNWFHSSVRAEKAVLASQLVHHIHQYHIYAAHIGEHVCAAASLCDSTLDSIWLRFIKAER